MCPDQNRQGRRCAAFFYTPVLSRMIGHPLYNWVAANGNRLSSVRLERVNSRDPRRNSPPQVRSARYHYFRHPGMTKYQQISPKPKYKVPLLSYNRRLVVHVVYSTTWHSI